jgi:hypothetical protein
MRAAQWVADLDGYGAEAVDLRTLIRDMPERTWPETFDLRDQDDDEAA